MCRPSRLDLEVVNRNRNRGNGRHQARVSPTPANKLVGLGRCQAMRAEGQRYFLRHYLMIGRFHSALELACNASGGRAELFDWRQGPALWNQVEAPRIKRNAGQWMEIETTERIAHRPDAYFSLKRTDEDEARHCLYEVDRKTSSRTRPTKKLRGHFLFVVRSRGNWRHMTPITAAIRE